MRSKSQLRFPNFYNTPRYIYVANLGDVTNAAGPTTASRGGTQHKKYQSVPPRFIVNVTSCLIRCVMRRL